MGMTEAQRFQEQMRIIDLVRHQDPDHDLLDALLDGEEKSARNVLELRKFVVANFETQIRGKVLAAIDDFLSANGVKPPVEVQQPSPYANVLEQLDDEERTMNARLQAYAVARGCVFDAALLRKYCRDEIFRAAVIRETVSSLNLPTLAK